MMNLIRCAVLALMLVPVAGAAHDYNAGLAAYLAGDHARALREWRPLAEQGNAVAQFSLGLMYNNGQGVPQDYAEAARWYRLAAEQGNANAQFNLGIIYANGFGVTQDDVEAVRWYRQAAIQGNAEAQNHLGGMYATGRSVLEDYTTAHMWFNIAAANGSPTASTLREFVASRMVAADISEAQRRARVCIASEFQDCD
jgi:hypothetical protein